MKGKIVDKPKQTTVSQVANELGSHERECAVRYENLEKRLDRGDQRFGKIEQMIWGIYVLLIASSVIAESVR